MKSPSPLFCLALLFACKSDPKPGEKQKFTDPKPNPAGDADIFVAEARLGDAIPSLTGQMLASYERGREQAARAFHANDGLGPTFNADSCGGCHQFPVVGGSAPRYRDFWLVKKERWDGALEDAGSAGHGPVRNLYSLHGGHVAESADTVLYARRNAPPMFGLGLLAFIADQDILALEDEDDADGDGISGRANYEQGRVGRFGYKSQASRVESFNRGAILNQMGITTNPLFYVFPEEPPAPAEVDQRASALGAWLPLTWLEGTAKAQVSAPAEPTTDLDDVADPEMSDTDQLDLLVFSTYIGVPEPAALDVVGLRGADLFEDAGCVSCHVPRLDSTIGSLPLYSDLLLHDMGEELADGIEAGLATGSEFRTGPLWGIAMHGPWMHDGRADSLHDAILAHGGEGQASRDAYADLSAEDQHAMEVFLQALGGHDPGEAHFTSFEAAVPTVGEHGGPLAGLSGEALASWTRGRALFDHDIDPAVGLGTRFNADSCRACHQDPVLGGAGGADTSVLRIGTWHEDGSFTNVASAVIPRSVVPGQPPWRMPDEVNVVEPRQPPTILGIGLLQGIDEAAIFALEDPDDLDGDGISGRARVLADGRLGRFGWKAQVPSVKDFAADALLNEIGLTVDPAESAFTTDDDGDDIADPELGMDQMDDLVFYLTATAAPPRKAPAAGVDASAGEASFATVGCASCHVPELDGVAAWTDMLLHDVSPEGTPLVDQEDGLDPGEFRTPPLWDVGQTPPYMHGGQAVTLEESIAAHGGEADASRLAFEALSDGEKQDLIGFLNTL